MPSFNLVEEPWIPCVMGGNEKQHELSLRQVFERAREVREISHPSPLVTAALFRLLLAIIHRNFAVNSFNDWKNLWNLGTFNSSKLYEYLDQWHHRFNLFAEERPFYQVPYMDSAVIHPIAYLTQEKASGNNATLFDHSYNATPAPIPAAEAACYLLASQGFSIGFGNSKPFYFSDSPLTRGFTVMVTGENLFESLMLNFMIWRMPSIKNDLPTWEQEQPETPDKNGTIPSGPQDYLTWQSRRIHLIPETEGFVRYCQVQQNLKVIEDVLDPFKCYAKSEKRGLVPLSLNPEKALWRDSHTLFQDLEIHDRNTKRPEILNWMARVDSLRRNGQIDAQPNYNLHIFGMATEIGKAASVILWRHERLPLPLAYLNNEDLLQSLRHGLGSAENVGRVVNTSAWMVASTLLAPSGDRKPDQKSVNQLADNLGAERAYWSRLEGPFKRFMVALADEFEEGQGDGEQSLSQWASDLRRAAQQAFEEVTMSLDTSDRTLKAVAIAESAFNRRLFGIVGNYLK